MDERKQEYLGLLDQKLEALTNMLEATQAENFTCAGDQEVLESEAERFTALYEQRDNIIGKIKVIDETIAAGQLEADKALLQAGKPTLDKIKKTARNLVELDKKNLEASRKLTEFLKGHLKKIRDGHSISNIYVDPHESTSGYYFDRTH
jgi:hypothetical protein